MSADAQRLRHNYMPEIGALQIARRSSSMRFVSPVAMIVPLENLDALATHALVVATLRP